MTDKFKPENTDLLFFRGLYNLAETNKEDVEQSKKDWKNNHDEYDGLIDPEIKEDE